MSLALIFFFFFFNDTATTEIYTLSLHDALPISKCPSPSTGKWSRRARFLFVLRTLSSLRSPLDRKSTRLNSSHSQISYAVFCLKKKKPGLFRARLQNFLYTFLSCPRYASTAHTT